MGKTAFMFPGQGAQYVGMGKDFYEQIPVCREMFELAGRAGGLDVAALCFEENEQINITEYTQIAMLAAEVAILKAIEERGLKPDVTAGLSLGEYGAQETWYLYAGSRAVRRHHGGSPRTGYRGDREDL